MNFMNYGKAPQKGVPGSRTTFIPEKYWAPTTTAKPNSRHDLFFKPQPEDLETQIPKGRTNESNDDTILTIKATSFFDHEESTLYMAITEGRGNASCEVGIAAIDINRPELIVSQISDNFWYTGLLTMIAIQSPKEILLPQALINSNKTSKLYLYVKQTYPDVPIRAVPRRQFNDKKALEIIDHIHNSKYESIRDMISKKYYALTASSALLQYLEYILNYSFAPNSLKLRYESKYGCMTIDLDTSHHLELLYPTCKTKEQRACLFGVLNSCVTSIGRRNLRALILQPSCDLKQITKTQECIKELFANQTLFLSLESTVAKFHSVDKLMKFAVMDTSYYPNSSETIISQILQLKTCLETIPELSCLLATITNNYFDDMKTMLITSTYNQMLNEINLVIHPNAQVTGGTTQFFQRLHAVNPKISSYLDLNRTNYTKLVDQMNEIIGNLSAAHNQPFRMKFINSKGFHIQLTVLKNSAFPQLPNTFEVLSKTKNSINLTTNELRMLNIRMFDVVEQIHIESNRIIGELVEHIRNNMAQLYDFCGLISSLDIILSLTKYSINSNGCCPSFGSEMNVIDGIHPLLEHNRCKTTPIPNGVIANSEYHFFVITGPNMGGKTIYLKMIAMLQILAQLGCFVPARKAQFRLTDKILSRIGFGDRTECNLSGFVLEMRETEYIFKNITPNSLVIIDELCRSTKPEEGEVLAWDICERLIRLVGISNDGCYFDESPGPSTSKSTDKSLKLTSITSPFIFFVTHFDSITKLQDKFLSVVNLHFSATEELIDGKNHLTYTYRVEDGVNQIKNYGISLAQNMNFPPDVISRAMAISEELRQTQLPERSNRTNFLFDNSSANKRSTFRSTLLETSTSEQSHLLRLFYDLYADMIQISRMGTSTEEKQKELNLKMKELAENLPSHVLDMARKGNLFDLFRRSCPNKTANEATNEATTEAINICTTSQEKAIEDERQLDQPNSQIQRSSTHYSLLSNHSIARRIGLEMEDIYQDDSKISLSLKPSERKSKNQSKIHFQTRSVVGTPTQSFENFLMESQFRRNTPLSSSFMNDDFNFDFMNSNTQFIDHELTQHFSNMSPKSADANFVEDKNATFSISKFSDKSRSYQNTPTEFQLGASLKGTKPKSVTSNTSQKSSSSSTPGLFRLQLKTPLKIKDNRILKTPPKSNRVRNVPKEEFTFGRSKDTSERRSTSRLTFNLFNDSDFSSVEIPEALSTNEKSDIGVFTGANVPTIEFTNATVANPVTRERFDESFRLNFTQFCANERNDDSFLDSSQKLKTDVEEMFPDFPDEISPFSLDFPTGMEDEPFAFPGMSTSYSKRKSPSGKKPTKAIDKNTSSHLSGGTCASTSREHKQNIVSLTKNIEKVTAFKAHPTSSSRNVTLAPEMCSSSALKFIQLAYQDQSDNDSASDEEEIPIKVIAPAETKKSSSKSDQKIVEKKKAEKMEKKTEAAAVTEGQSLSAKHVNVPTVNLENMEDIILPVPSQFL
ncbi:MutS protein like 4 [Pseudolycoriella hygida]|uniref:MutS protein like 4 n=1 Tax=Pseudolycoriella hygida TaxID=35572 RepID=A0A9Q0N8A1_9DIPT|nr:MutS protein like 4 [Pseudolycoriella hygida]